MPTTPAGGYFTEAAYTHGYYREMCPAHLRFCLLLRGLRPPAPAGFDYCELAMGNGFSANVHAAANSGRFSGLDFSPEHAARAADLAGRGQSGLAVSADSFEEALKREHPPYDYICLHGGWSWVSASNHGQILEFAQRFLKPGGVFYLSYNCHPGWSAAAPLRKLFTLFGESDESGDAGDVRGTARIQKAMERTGEFLRSGPLYLNSAAWLMEKFESLRKQPPEYLAHEFFNADWHVVYFSDLAEKLAEAGLRFGASAFAQNNIAGFGLTGPAARFLQGVPEVEAREQLWDFYCNSQFRADIFLKDGAKAGDLQLSGAEQRELLLALRFALVAPPGNISYVMDSGMGSFQLDERGHGAVVEILAEEGFRPKSLAEIHERLKSWISLRQALDILARLVGKGYVHPGLPAAEVEANAAGCRSFNTEVIHRAARSDELRYLASPQTGGGVAVSRLDMLFMQALAEEANPLPHVLDILESNGEQLTRHGEPVSGRAEILEILSGCHDAFLKVNRPLWQGLGLI